MFPEDPFFLPKGINLIQYLCIHLLEMTAIRGWSRGVPGNCTDAFPQILRANLSKIQICFGPPEVKRTRLSIVL